MSAYTSGLLKSTFAAATVGITFLTGLSPAMADDVPATGQTTCYDSFGVALPSCAGTGQDGEFQYGRTLSYEDKGDGTIRDRSTGLVWEKKSDDDGIHDKDNTYTWEEAFTEHVFALNHICEDDETVTCSVDGDCELAGAGDDCGFAGKQDWRLPNVRELSSIVNFGVFSDDESPTPTVSEVFNTDCVPGATVLTGSCTHADDVIHDPMGPMDGDFVPFGTGLPGTREGLRVPFTYWSSTSGDAPGDAWFVDYFTGDSGAHGTGEDLEIDICPSFDNVGGSAICSAPEAIFAGHVRAVRKGEFRGTR